MSALRLAGFFTDGMVLPADRPIPVWGWADPGTTVTVTLDEATATVTSDDAGLFTVTMPARTAGGGDSVLHVQAGEEQVRVTACWFGDLWLCAGQSNMEWMLNQLAAGSAVREAATDPAIRYWRPGCTWADAPGEDLRSTWRPATGFAAGECSAVGYHFAAAIRRHIDRPVGLVQVARGGSLLEAWLPVDDADPATVARRDKVLQERRDFATANVNQPTAWADWLAASEGAGLGGIVSGPPPYEGWWLSCNQIGACDLALVRPLRRLPLRGVIWYQGESNADCPQPYPRLFARMVAHWRQLFGDPDLPVHTVQLAGWEHETERLRGSSGQVIDDLFPALRAAQEAAVTIPGVTMVPAIDVGDHWDIHPEDKASVGERLARQALYHQYEVPVTCDGPRLDQVHRVGGALRLSYKDQPCLRTADGGVVQGIQVRDADGSWTALPGRIDAGGIVVDLPPRFRPVELAYAWAGWQVLNLEDVEGLPAWPARRPVLPARPGLGVFHDGVPTEESHA